MIEEFPWMPFALAELGQHEITGAGDAPRVLEYLRTTTLPAALASQDETAWCSAFVNWCLEQAKCPRTHSAAARSWLTWGQALQVPRRGCIAVFSRDGGGPVVTTLSGHVAFYMRTVGHAIEVLGGNQHDRVCVAPYDQSRLLGYRVP